MMGEFEVFLAGAVTAAVLVFVAISMRQTHVDFMRARAAAWRPVKADRVVRFGVYRHRVTGMLVQVSKAGSRDDSDRLLTIARGMMWNTIKGEWQAEDILDDTLETNDPRLIECADQLAKSPAQP